MEGAMSSPNQSSPLTALAIDFIDRKMLHKKKTGAACMHQNLLLCDRAYLLPC